jgi:hypothetical protein
VKTWSHTNYWILRKTNHTTNLRMFYLYWYMIHVSIYIYIIT